MRRFFFLLLCIALFVLVATTLAATFTDDTQSEFDAGTYSNTAWNTNHVELSSGQTSGTFTSQVFDGSAGASWTGIAWSETLTSADKLIVVDSTAKIWKSVDNGAAWTSVNSDYNGSDGNAATDMVIDGNNTLTVLDGQDVWTSTDAGVGWTKVNDDYNGSENQNAQRVAVNSSGHVFIVESDEDIWRSTDGGTSWTKQASNMNGSNGNVFGFVVVGTTLHIVDTTADIWTSTDAGVTWTLTKDDYNGSDSNNADYLTANSGGALFILNGQDVWTSTDAGVGWTKVNDDYNGSESNSGLVIKRNSSNHLFIAEGDEDIWRSTDGGTSWTKQGNTGGADTKGMVYIAVTTDVTFGARSGDTNPPTASFSGSLTDPSGGNPSVSSARYFQYRATLTSGDGAVTPEISNVTVTYTAGVLAATSSADTAWVKGGVTGKNVVISVGNKGESTAAIQWVKITRPGANFTLTAGSASGWSASASASAVTFTGGSIAVGAEKSFTVTLDAASLDTAQASWTVDADNDGDGSSSVAASAASSGALSTGIDATAPTSVSVSSAVADSDTQISATAAAASDASSGLHATPYWFDETSGNTGGTDSTLWQASVLYADSGLTAAVQYCYRVKARDVVGNESAFSNAVCATTNAAPDTTPPTLSGIDATSITQTTAVITWTTNENADSKVEYGESTGYGSVKTDSAFLTSHSLQITGLRDNTLYNYRVISKDSSGNTATSTNRSFLTQTAVAQGGGGPTIDTTPPTISGVSALPSTRTATVTWKTNELARGFVEYGVSAGYGSSTPKSNLESTHTATLAGLAPDTSYHYRISVEDVDLNKRISGDFSFTTEKTSAEEKTSTSGEKPDEGTADSTGAGGKKLVLPAPHISGLSVAGVQPTSAKVAWETDIPGTSQVRFGVVPGSYNQITIEFATLVNKHALTLSDLAPETTYYFIAVSRASAGGEGVSSEGSFRTESLEIQTVVDIKRPVALPPGSPGTQIARTAPGETLTAVPILSTPGDTTVPEVTLLTFVENPTENTSPTIRGVARDTGGVIASIAYSTDGGTSWHPISEVEGIGSSRAQFSARIPNLRDGNYPVLFRVRDNSGLVGVSETRELVIDIVPPATGANVVLLGSQSLIPDRNGRLTTLKGITQRFVLSSVGGAVAVRVIAVPETLRENNDSAATTREQSFPLSYSKKNDLWFGDVTLSHPGNYQLFAEAVDGAGRSSRRPVNPLFVADAGSVVDSADKQPITGAVVSLFQFSAETGGYILWPGEIFNQANPYTTGPDGSYRFIVPPGRYFLRVTRGDYQTLYSDIKELAGHGALNYALALTRKPRLSATLPFFGVRTITPPVVPAFTTVATRTETSPYVSPFHPLIGKPAPLFSLPHTSGETVDIRYLRGKKTIISVWNTWSPLAQAQIPVLDGVGRRHADDLNIVLLSLQESEGVIASYLARGSYALESFVDTAGSVTDRYPVATLPEHFFLDRRGVIRDVHVGFLNSAQLESKLGEL